MERESITEFRGKYVFLSNFYEAPVFFEGLMYRNNEAAFQSAKILDRSKRMIFLFTTVKSDNKQS